MFGIDDCIKPKKNTKKKHTFNLKTRRIVTKTNKPYNYKTIVLFLHSLGQAHKGTEKAPLYINKFINHKKHNVKTVANTDNFYKNINKLYKVDKNIRGKIVNIGGDHSMSIATIADTLNKHPNAKVIYFDAHADINTYSSSHSKHYHGMPLSFVTGLDKDTDKRFPFIKNKLPFKNLLYIGSRCWDAFEIDIVDRNNIKYLTPDDINNNFKDSLQKIMDFVGDSPVHVSFDVDSIDPKYIPSTGTPVKDGIQLNKAITILESLNNTNIVNMDITELNMSLGSKADGINSGKNTVALFKKFII